MCSASSFCPISSKKIFFQNPSSKDLTRSQNVSYWRPTDIGHKHTPPHDNTHTHTHSSTTTAVLLGAHFHIAKKNLIAGTIVDTEPMLFHQQQHVAASIHNESRHRFLDLSLSVSQTEFPKNCICE